MNNELPMIPSGKSLEMNNGSEIYFDTSNDINDAVGYSIYRGCRATEKTLEEAIQQIRNHYNTEDAEFEIIEPKQLPPCK